MKAFFKAINLHILFIILTQILYTLVYLFRHDVLETYWLFLYNGICLFIYLGAGWSMMHETGRRLWTALAGLTVFYIGYIVYAIGVLLVAPLIYHLPWNAAAQSLPKLLQFSLFYAALALVLAFIGGHLCHQKKRFKHSAK